MHAVIRLLMINAWFENDKVTADSVSGNLASQKDGALDKTQIQFKTVLG